MTATQEIGGDIVAETLERLRALLTPADAWTQGAFARTADGVALTTPAAIRDQAVCRCLLGGVETVAVDVALQGVVVQALKNALADVGERYATAHRLTVAPTRFVNLSQFNDESPKAEVLALIESAQALAPTRKWPARTDQPLPQRPPTAAEVDDLQLEAQCISDLWFATDLHAGQHNATVSLRDAAGAREAAIANYLPSGAT